MAGTVDKAALKAGGLMPQVQQGKYSLRVLTIGGNMTAEQIATISKVAQKYGHGYVHMTSRQGIEIPFIDVEDVDVVKAELLEGGVPTGVCGPRVRTVTACQGKDVCPNGLINTYEIAEEFHKRYFGRELPHKFKFGVTGCRANCLKTEENDFGVKGGMEVKVDNEKCKKCGVCVKTCRWNAITLDKATGISFDQSKCVKCGRCVKACPFDAWSGEAGYVVSLGGLFGNEIYKGESFLPLIKDKDTLFRVADAAITFFAENAKPSERFRFTIQRTGEENFRKVIFDAYKGVEKSEEKNG
jgi:dissimilatory sulfite reductase (desulfoviridin) alpha/beta subunit